MKAQLLQSKLVQFQNNINKFIAFELDFTLDIYYRELTLMKAQLLQSKLVQFQNNINKFIAFEHDEGLKIYMYG